MKLNPVTYTYSIEKSNRLQNRVSKNEWEGKFDIEKVQFSGFLAQEVEKTAKEIGYSFSGVDKPQDENGLWGLRYAEFVVPLVKAVQEQQRMINTYESEIKQLKDQIENINKNLLALTSALPVNKGN
jgi:trimeric autotransporter adhesin